MKRWTMITVKCEIHHIETIILSSDTEIPPCGSQYEWAWAQTGFEILYITPQLEPTHWPTVTQELLNWTGYLQTMENKQTGDAKYVTIKISQLVMEKMLPYKKSERWHKTNDLFPLSKFLFFSFIKLVLSGICHWWILSDCSNVWLGLFTWQMCFKRSVFKLAWLASSAAWLAEMIYRFIFRLSKVCWFIWFAC